MLFCTHDGAPAGLLFKATHPQRRRNGRRPSRGVRRRPRCAPVLSASGARSRAPAPRLWRVPASGRPQRATQRRRRERDGGAAAVRAGGDAAKGRVRRLPQKASLPPVSKPPHPPSPTPEAVRRQSRRIAPPGPRRTEKPDPTRAPFRIFPGVLAAVNIGPGVARFSGAPGSGFKAGKGHGAVSEASSGIGAPRAVPAGSGSAPRGARGPLYGGVGRRPRRGTAFGGNRASGKVGTRELEPAG